MANKETSRENSGKVKPQQRTQDGGTAKKTVNRPAQNAVQKPMKKPAEASAQKSVQNIAKQPGQNAAQKSLKQAKDSQKKAAPAQRGGAQPRVRVGQVIYAILVTLAAAALAFFIWARAQNTLSVPENAVGSLLSPVQNAVNAVTLWVDEKVQSFRDRNKLQEDYEDAQLEIMTLNYRVSQLEEQEQENIRLRALLDAQQRYQELDPIYARVIAKESGRWFDVFAINRGTLNGVKAGMAVINEDGLIGRVYEAGMDYAKIISIIDPRSAAACLIQRTRDNGVMKGQIAGSSDDASCNMYYVPSVNDIVPGDEVITSGLDGLYPKGLVVGTVREVSRQSDTSDQYVVITPSVDFQRIEDVLVLQTVIETAEGEILSPLPSPTTRAKPTENVATATPDPSVTATPVNQPNNWAYPMVTPDPNATSAPIVGGVRPEEQWAQGN